jgi:hypothetical protein
MCHGFYWTGLIILFFIGLALLAFAIIRLRRGPSSENGGEERPLLAG